MVAASIALQPGERLAYRLRILRPPVRPATLRVDLFARGYDNVEQERSHLVGYGSYPFTINGHFSAGAGAPAAAQFRIFYDGEAGLALDDIRIVRVPAWRVWLEYAIAIAALLSVFATTAGAIRVWLSRPPLSRYEAACSLVAIFGLGIVTRFAFSLLLPYWSGDEYVYKGIATGLWAGGGPDALNAERLAHSVDIPNLLYPLAIAPAMAMGDQFYTGIRLINAAIMSSVVVPAFAIGKRLAGDRVALLVACFALAMPSASIAAYAATEALYYPVALFVLWLTLCAAGRPRSVMAQIAVGVAIGVAMNIRLTALALLPAYLVAFAIVHLQTGQIRTLVTRPTWIAGVAAALVTHYSIRALLAAGPGMGAYENHSAGWGRKALDAVASDPAGAATLFAGHAAILALPYALGIGALAYVFFGGERSDENRRRDATVVLVSVAAAFALAIVFTLSVSGTDLGGLGRWHSRYYFAYLPPLIASAAAWIGRPWTVSAASAAAGFAIAMLLIAASAFVGFSSGFNSPWFGSMVDSMEAQWLVEWGGRGFGIALLASTLIVAFAWRARAPQYFLAGIVIWLAFANVATWRTLRDGPGADDARCGALVSLWLQANPGTITAIASSRADLVDLVFWLPELPQKAITVPPSTVLAPPFGDKSNFVAVAGEVQLTGAQRLLSVGRCSIFSSQRPQ